MDHDFGKRRSSERPADACRPLSIPPRAWSLTDPTLRESSSRTLSNSTPFTVITTLSRVIIQSSVMPDDDAHDSAVLTCNKKKRSSPLKTRLSVSGSSTITYIGGSVDQIAVFSVNSGAKLLASDPLWSLADMTHVGAACLGPQNLTNAPITASILPS